MPILLQFVIVRQRSVIICKPLAVGPTALRARGVGMADEIVIVHS